MQCGSPYRQLRHTFVIFSMNVFYSFQGWYREDPITEAGKRRQMAKMLTLILTPIIVLLCVSFYFVSDNIIAKMESDKVPLHSKPNDLS